MALHLWGHHYPIPSPFRHCTAVSLTFWRYFYYNNVDLPHKANTSVLCDRQKICPKTVTTTQFWRFTSHIRGGYKISSRRGPHSPGGANIWYSQMFQKMHEIEHILGLGEHVSELFPLDPPLHMIHVLFNWTKWMHFRNCKQTPDVFKSVWMWV